MLCSPPTAYRQFVLPSKCEYFSQRPLMALKQCVGAREPLNGEVIRIWKEMSDIEIRDGYGQTETTLVCGKFWEGLRSSTAPWAFLYPVCPWPLWMRMALYYIHIYGLEAMINLDLLCNLVLTLPNLYMSSSAPLVTAKDLKMSPIYFQYFSTPPEQTGVKKLLWKAGYSSLSFVPVHQME